MCLSLSVNFGQLAKPYKDRFHFNSLHIGYSKFISTQYEYPLLCSFLFVSIISVPLKITKWHFLFPHLMFELSFSLFRLDPIITNNPTSGAKKTSVSFSKNSDVSLQWFLLTCRDVVHLSFLGVAIIKYMWRLNYRSYYFLFDVFQCILVGDSKGELTVYQLRSMPEPPANQVCLSLYIVWHNTVLIKGISKTLSNIHGLIPQASRALC